MTADSLATALMVLGPDEGLDWATQRDVAAVFVVRTGAAGVQASGRRRDTIRHDEVGA